MVSFQWRLGLLLCCTRYSGIQVFRSYVEVHQIPRSIVSRRCIYTSQLLYIPLFLAPEVYDLDGGASAEHVSRVQAGSLLEYIYCLLAS